MKKIVITIAATAAFFVPVGTGVLAQSPSPTITVVAEPPGENCEFGGVKVTVTPAEEPTPEPTEEPTPDPTEEPTPDPTEDPTEEPTDTPTVAAAQAAEPTVEYVCNGQPGEPGQDGQDGQDGTDGQDGDNGLDGMDADADTPGIQATPANRCATAKTVKVKLPRRFHNRVKVRVTANAQRRSARVRRHKVSVNLRRVPCGYYPVLVQKRGVRSYLIVLRFTPHRVSLSRIR